MDCSHEYYIDCLHKELQSAVGCTEPAAVAYAVAVCINVLGKQPETIDVYASRNILKNAMGVGIPGTSMHGLEIAIALSCVCGDAGAGLDVLHAVTSAAVDAAQKMLENEIIHVHLLETKKKIAIRVEISAGVDRASVVIEDEHTNIVRVERNAEQISYINPNDNVEVLKNREMSLSEIYEFCKSVDVEKLLFLKDCIEMNTAIAEEGITNDYGLCVGKSMYELMKRESGQNDWGRYAEALTCAAVDARMSGSMMPVMTSCGSGNQGLTATIPVIVVSRCLKSTESDLLRALAMSLLVLIHVKSHMGRLSSLCGCSVASSIGAACGIIQLLNGDLAAMCRGIQNVIADQSGVICDGAKAGCSLKIASGVASACRGAILAMENHGANEYDGIVCGDVEKSIDNLGRLTVQESGEMDRKILNMLLSK